ncbi:MAG: glutamine--fructose-6-phosphate transaminase (isomerizing) [Candidatus Moraniibacteriota bacterium]|nr:MAG: glutamine--fructose-6-phosphate transaminase (isomerizing) [Candidatus Moranbacteria bacterium]
MCGIVGYIGKRSAKKVLLEGLKQLEYRGYDSSGMAVILKNKEKEENFLEVIKAVGRVSNLEEKLFSSKAETFLGIAHTRWATHGKPSEKNAHPHLDMSKRVAIVHNGIIENYTQLKESLKKKKCTFVSETDSEVIAQLIGEKMKTMDFESAFFKTLLEIRGAYAIVAISSEDPEKILAARLSSPLVLGVGKEEFILASDPSAIAEYTDRVVYLDDNEAVIITKGEYSLRTLSNQSKKLKEPQLLEWSGEKVKKGEFAHYMLKEIFEQPLSLKNTLRGRILLDDGMARLGGLSNVEKKLRGIERILLVGCGTARCAGLVGKYMLEEYAGIPTEVEYAHEFRYKKSLLDKKTVVIALSQSGETADTLAAIREAKNRGALTLGIVNVVGSTISRETDAGVYNHAGPEIAVASTKAFTSQLVVLALLTVFLGRRREMSLVMGKRILREMEMLPKKIEFLLQNTSSIKKLAKKYSQRKNFFFLGRKYNYPVALEGAIKLKEISYIHAEGLATGELKHGPIAMIDKEFPSLFLAPKDSVYEKSLTGMEEVRSRGGDVLAIVTKGDKKIAHITKDYIEIPKTLEMLTPILSVIPLQLFSYFVSVERGLDVDKPRNLAKSVTVE